MTFLKNRNYRYLFSALTGTLLSLSWPAGGFPPLIFIAFIPLLLMEDFILQNKIKSKNLFAHSYTAFLIWNVATTWWVWFASPGGSIMAFVFNALFMALVFQLFHITRKRCGNLVGYISLPAYWLSFEQLHFSWDLAWPWLALGNVFATMPSLVQWYEFTGVQGGTLWIIVVNILFFAFVRKIATEKVTKLLHWVYRADAVLLFPILISVIRYSTYTEKENPLEVAVVQPNIDPYNEKFSGLNAREQVEKLLKLASTVADSTTDYVIGPETALPFTIWEHEIKEHPDVRLVKNFMGLYPDMKFIVGLSSAKQYDKGEKLSVTARKFRDADLYYDSYNTAMLIGNDSGIQLYHKSKLVPGVEKMPYPKVFGFLEDYAIDMGGTAGSLGIQDDPTVFTVNDSSIAAPIICYESVFGNYVAGYVRKGATWLVIITNDGWWGDTPGYRQHLHYARLRAIETRRSIARSANTGISAFINQRGDIVEQTGWWVQAAIKQKINLNNKLTIYSKYGNRISSISEIIALVSILFLLKKIIGRKN